MEKIKLQQAGELYYKMLDHPKMIIEGLLSTGLAMLSGDPKIGKSWMVLMFCLNISKGEPIWGLPTAKTDVIYLALEDREYRIQDRMQKLTDTPPENLYFGFSCGKIGAELEGQIEEILKEKPDIGAIFIDTLQMVRDNVISRTNAYAQDYKDLAVLKRIADKHGILIFIVHHTRKEHDSSNVFNNASGTTALAGAADTNMILQKEDRFGTEAVLSVTGRDIEEKQLKLCFKDTFWEVTEELNAAAIRKEEAPPFIHRLAELCLAEKEVKGTMSEILAMLGETELKPNKASHYLMKYYPDILQPLGIEYQSRRTAATREVILTLHDDDDKNDDTREIENPVSSAQKDNISSVSHEPSQSSSLSQTSADHPDFFFEEVPAGTAELRLEHIWTKDRPEAQ